MSYFDFGKPGVWDLIVEDAYEGLVDALDPEWFTNMLTRGFQLKYNNVILTTGETSTGKSYSDLKLAEFLFSKFDVYKHVIFKPLVFLKREPEYKKILTFYLMNPF